MNDWVLRLGLWLARQSGWDEKSVAAPLHDLLAQAQLQLRARHANVKDLETQLSEAQALMESHRRESLQARQQAEQSKQHVTSLAETVHQLQAEIAGLKARTAITVNESPIAEDLLLRARAISDDANTTLSGGEAKRHYTYARLIKEFPDTDRRTLGLAIELALPPKEG